MLHLIANFSKCWFTTFQRPFSGQVLTSCSADMRTEGDGVLLTGMASDMSCEIRSARVYDERPQIDHNPVWDLVTAAGG